uniref:Uncharacterized protein n=1 Tax=Trichobilharzia regenti TaxID=157069 RepID=A0AA85J325_TRIRE|nr:unnamed protein product [Trichobilharzia regenti]
MSECCRWDHFGLKEDKLCISVIVQLRIIIKQPTDYLIPIKFTDTFDSVDHEITRLIYQHCLMLHILMHPIHHTYNDAKCKIILNQNFLESLEVRTRPSSCTFSIPMVLFWTEPFKKSLEVSSSMFHSVKLKTNNGSNFIM